MDEFNRQLLKINPRPAPGADRAGRLVWACLLGAWTFIACIVILAGGLYSHSTYRLESDLRSRGVVTTAFVERTYSVELSRSRAYHVEFGYFVHGPRGQMLWGSSEKIPEAAYKELPVRALLRAVYDKENPAKVRVDVPGDLAVESDRRDPLVPALLLVAGVAAGAIIAISVLLKAGPR